MKFQIKIDGRETTIWRQLPRTRPNGYRTRNHYEQPGFYGGHFHPRRLGPVGISLEITSQQAGFELWTEEEKLEVWPAQALAFDDLAAIDPTAKCVTTKAGVAVPAQVTRKALSGEEYRSVQQERMIAAISVSGAVPAAEERKRSLAEKSCATCGWVHDARFHQIVIPGEPPVTLAGLLPKIVACVHAAHAKNQPSLSTKDDDLLRICGGYRNPCKAFYDLHEKRAYKALFDTSRRGLIALRGFGRKES